MAQRGALFRVHRHVTHAEDAALSAAARLPIPRAAAHRRVDRLVDAFGVGAVAAAAARARPCCAAGGEAGAQGGGRGGGGGGGGGRACRGLACAADASLRPSGASEHSVR
eukprot:3275471-Pleurochrysis_carterae.AAC.1